MHLRKALIVGISVALASTRAIGADVPISCREAGKHVGEVRTVCGTMTQRSYRADIRGEPTFLNCGGV